MGSGATRGRAGCGSELADGAALAVTTGGGGADASGGAGAALGTTAASGGAAMAAGAGGSLRSCRVATVHVTPTETSTSAAPPAVSHGAREVEVAGGAALAAF